MEHEQRRPRFFNLMQIQMPVGALTSIGHRVSGIILALCVPFYIYVLQLSLQSPRGYALAAGILGRLPVKALVAASIWALAHHVLAGIRHLLSDVDIGSPLPAARTSAWAVNCAGLVILLLAAGALL
ncbi:succinate dehydrogenase, cytochrome b556 subunit [Massilia agilis]|uniref:Succinate dehydrogenase cytochrome b556 subunit n=1 Tax=Massilia agilis TaxID=1811226 RepID=A0ABT2D8T1_9BURK|nr:succinate dehydrogenase, cytochrome b556 subunit [Massilia agilis]MCS0807572.1 succinate dehydrogenase, cytochrome b556 subunit [Massilia agilis]